VRVSAVDVFGHGHKMIVPISEDQLARARAVRMPFGKYKHKPLGDIPLSYLRWARANCDNMSGSLRTFISMILGDAE
jgi:uncharacterized protein (DUF3820 family)